MTRKLGDPRIPLDDAAEELALAAQFAGAYGSPCRAIDEDGAERLTVRATSRHNRILHSPQAPEKATGFGADVDLVWPACAGTCRRHTVWAASEGGGLYLKAGRGN
eukprot:COSAG02_NODE_11520_length_1707_cov_2.000622_2_plen_106_part_00